MFPVLVRKESQGSEELFHEIVASHGAEWIEIGGGRPHGGHRAKRRLTVAHVRSQLSFPFAEGPFTHVTDEIRLGLGWRSPPPPRDAGASSATCPSNPLQVDSHLLLRVPKLTELTGNSIEQGDDAVVRRLRITSHRSSPPSVHRSATDLDPIARCQNPPRLTERCDGQRASDLTVPAAGFPRRSLRPKLDSFTMPRVCSSATSGST